MANAIATDTKLSALAHLLTAAGMTKSRNQLVWTHKGEGVRVEVRQEGGLFAAYQVD